MLGLAKQPRTRVMFSVNVVRSWTLARPPAPPTPGINADFQRLQGSGGEGKCSGEE